jgi:hypothetical protein
MLHYRGDDSCNQWLRPGRGIQAGVAMASSELVARLMRRAWSGQPGANVLADRRVDDAL